ncbi:MAG: hypothetical protein ACFFCQ_12585 [Promethearchaeota archaeon]
MIKYSINPIDSDSDRDGLPDGWEINNNLKPLIDDANEDSDNDKLVNLQEYLSNSDPWNSDSDNDFVPDGLVHNWWGNPRGAWNNPLTRSLLLILLPGLIGLGYGLDSLLFNYLDFNRI